jgi:MFS family permease
MTVTYDQAAASRRSMTGDEIKVILASSLGTIFEWYDFYLYGSLAVLLGAKFFSSFDVSTRNIFALLAFAAGFIVRPFGALVFGRLGDLIGRKATFLATILIMGSCTFLLGLLPDYATIGWVAPVLLIALRMAQGLALGGEYGGAVIYVAEHAPKGRRGFYTSWITITPTLGLLLSLMVSLWLRQWMGEKNFTSDFEIGIFGLQGGWRVPFLISIVLLVISFFIRLSMNESPAFQRMKAEGARSKAPLSEAFFQWASGRVVLLALFGLIIGQAVVWYTGQFYALFFLSSVLKTDLLTSNALIAWSLILSAPAFIFFGWLSDKIGRRVVILGSCLIAALTYFPIFGAVTGIVNPRLEKALAEVPVRVTADPAQCGPVFDPVGIRTFTTPCDIARRVLASSAIKHEFAAAPPGTAATVTVGTMEVAIDKDFASNVSKAAVAAGYPAASDPGILKVSGMVDAISNSRSVLAIGFLTLMLLYVAGVNGPIGAALVEFFPTRIRYSAMSFPYHIGNGWFGGLLPATAFAMTASTGDIYFGLWYPVGFAALTAIIGLVFVRDFGERYIDH